MTTEAEAMRTGDPRHAVKFMARVDEERAEEAAVVLRESVAPSHCYALYDTELDMRTDTLGREDLLEGRPHSGDLVAGEIGDLLVSPLRGTRHTVLYRSSLPDEAISLAYAAQTQVSAFLHRKEARARVQEQLLPILTTQRGYLGVLVLRSMNAGFVAGRGTVPRGPGEHRGEGRGPDRKAAASSTVLCECVTLWETESSLEAGVGGIAGSLPGMPEGELASDLIDRFVHTERGEFVARA